MNTLFFCLFVSSCNSETKEVKVKPVMPSEILCINNYSTKSGHLIKLNGEPLSCLPAKPCFFRWKDFPLTKGKNVLSMIPLIKEEFESSNYEVLLDNGTPRLLVEVNKNQPSLGDISFVFNNKVDVPNIVEQVVKKDEEWCKNKALEILQCVFAKDHDKLKSMFESMPDAKAKEIAVFLSDEVKIESHISKKENLTSYSGKNIVLVTSANCEAPLISGRGKDIDYSIREFCFLCGKGDQYMLKTKLGWLNVK